MSHWRNKKYLETYDNENMLIQNLWDAAKTILRGKFIAVQSYLKKQQKKNQQRNLTLTATRERTNKTQTSKEINHKDQSRNRDKTIAKN